MMDGTLAVAGGSITGNTATDGGVVFMTGGTVNVTGGTIGGSAANKNFSDQQRWRVLHGGRHDQR